jgi:hypothetical protein
LIDSLDLWRWRFFTENIDFRRNINDLLAHSAVKLIAVLAGHTKLRVQLLSTSLFLNVAGAFKEKAIFGAGAAIAILLHQVLAVGLLRCQGWLK